MKSLPILIVLSALYSIVFSQSQDWRPVRTDGTYLFKIWEEYRALRIDSTYSEGDTIKLYGFHELNFNEESNCYNPFGAPWFGKEIINYPDSTVIKNRNNESLVFPMKPYGEWIFFKNSNDTILAILKEERVEPFLGITDSIRIFQLYFSNMTYLPDEIWLSKHYGFLKCYNFERFLTTVGVLIDNSTYSLVGASQVSNTISNLTSKEVFDYEVGDEFHIKESYESWDYPNYQFWVIKSIKTITSKTVQPDSSSVTYTFHICSSSGEYDGTEIINFFDFWLDSLPYIMNKSEDLFQTGITFQFDSKYGAITKGLGVGFQKYTDSCYEFIHIDKNSNQIFDNYFPIPFYAGDYVKGLGGPYFYYQGFYSTSSNELVYYKKGNTEWGTPYHCEDLVSLPETVPKIFIDIYPNPVCDYITVNYQGPSTQGVFTLFDVSGKSIMSEPLWPGENTFLVDFLQNGNYLGVVTANNHKQYQIKLVKE